MPSIFLLRRSWREIRRRPGTSLLSILSVGVALALILSSTMFSASMQATLNNQRNLTRSADIEVFLHIPVSEQVVGNISALGNIEKIEPRILVFAQIREVQSSSNQSVPIFGVPSPQPSQVNPITVGPGTYFATSDEDTAIKSSAWEDEFKQFILYAVNESLVIQVRGTGTSLDLNQVKSLAMPLKTLQRLFFNESVVNSIYVRLLDPSKTPQATKEISQLLGSYKPDIRLTPREYFYDSYLEFLIEYVLIVGLVGLGLGAAIIFSSSKTKVDREAYEIGVYKSLGATRRDILTFIITDGFLLAGLSLLAGVSLGYLFLDLFLAVATEAAQVAAFGVVEFNPTIVLILSGLTTFLIMLATITSSHATLRSPPRESLQKRFGVKTPTRTRATLAFRSRFIWRGISGNKSRYISTGLIVLLSTGAALAMFDTVAGFQQVSNTVADSLADIWVSPYFAPVVNATSLMMVTGVQAVEPLATANILLSQGFYLPVWGIATPSHVEEFSGLLLKGRMIQSDAEVIISSLVASKTQLGIGDSLSFTKEALSNTTYSLKIVGIYSSPYPALEASFHFVQTTILSQDPSYAGIYIMRAESNVSISGLIKRLSALIPTAQIQDIRSRFWGSRYIVPFLTLSYSVVILMLLPSTVTVLTMITVDLLERRRDYAILRALGATPRQMIGSILLGTTLIVIPFTLLGIPLGLLLTNASLKAAANALFVPIPNLLSYSTQFAAVTIALEIGSTSLAVSPYLNDIVRKTIGEALTYE